MDMNNHKSILTGEDLLYTSDRKLLLIYRLADLYEAQATTTYSDIRLDLLLQALQPYPLRRTAICQCRSLDDSRQFIETNFEEDLSKCSLKLKLYRSAKQ
jgi:hypothetical protein